MPRELPLSAIDRRVARIQTAMAECERLDEAAGEAKRKVSLSEWISHRMKGAQS